MKINLFQKLLCIYLAILVVYWVILNRSGLTDGNWNYLYSFMFSLIPLIGGVVGVLSIAKSWGGFRSAIGKSIILFSLGLVTWGLGSMIWAYYNFFLGIPAPYPSLADIGYVITWPLWVCGIYYLSKATGAKYALKNAKGKLLIVVVPLVSIVISYYLLIVVARGGVVTQSAGNYLTLFFDFAYPTMDLFILTLALLTLSLSFEFFGGKFKIPVFAILAGLFLFYIGDFVFIYTVTIEKFYTGNFGDLIYTFAFFILTFGVLGFKWNKGPQDS